MTVIQPIHVPHLTADHRPTVSVTDRDLSEMTIEVAQHLHAYNDLAPTLFLLGGDVPVRVQAHPDSHRPITRPLDIDCVVHHLADAIQFVRHTKDGQTRHVAPPRALATNLLAAPTLSQWLPSLHRVVETPVFGRDGQLCHDGFNAETGVLCQPPPDADFPAVPPHPTDTEIADARVLLCHDLLGEFPFVAAAEKAHAVAALILPFVRDLIEGPTPLHLIEKPTAGTGGSLLADVLLRPALGRPLGAMTAGRDADEWRKRLTSVLAESPVAVRFDNVSTLDSDALAAVLTGTEWEDRPLGSTRIVHLPVRCVWLATANNPVIGFEIVRRIVRIRLDAGVDQPWLRDGWTHPDLVAWTMAHRAALIGAALTLAQAWLDAGQPVGAHPILGSFESWSRVMGGILSHAQIPGFLDNLPDVYATAVDDQTTVWHALVARWWNTHQSNAVGVAQIWTLIQGTADAPGIDLDLGDKSEKSQRSRLGRMIARHRDRIFDGYRITSDTPLNGSARWRLSTSHDLL